MKGWSLSAEGEMFCGEQQNNVGLWVCLHDGAGGEAKGVRKTGAAAYRSMCCRH